MAEISKIININRITPRLRAYVEALGDAIDEVAPERRRVLEQIAAHIH